MGALNCIRYLCELSLFGFLFGRILPKRWFRWDAFPYRPFSFEKNGTIYEKVNVKAWQNRVPDMSRILPWIMPKKELSGKPSADHMERMLQETCVAELIHWLVGISGFYALHLWPGWGGAALSLLYFTIGNLPFIVIQRYNRPRLRRLYTRLTKTGRAVTKPCEEYKNACIDPVL